MSMDMEEQQQNEQTAQSQVNKDVQNAIDHIARQLAYSNLTEYSGVINFNFTFKKGSLMDVHRQMNDNPLE